MYYFEWNEDNYIRQELYIYLTCYNKINICFIRFKYLTDFKLLQISKLLNS